MSLQYSTCIPSKVSKLISPKQVMEVPNLPRGTVPLSMIGDTKFPLYVYACEWDWEKKWARERERKRERERERRLETHSSDIWIKQLQLHYTNTPNSFFYTVNQPPYFRPLIVTQLQLAMDSTLKSGLYTFSSTPVMCDHFLRVVWGCYKEYFSHDNLLW